MSRPARSWSRMARIVASSCAASRLSGGTSHRSSARTRGTCFDSLSRSISQSGCGYEPTREVGSSISHSPPPKRGRAKLLRFNGLFERIDHRAGRVLGRREYGLIAHAPPGFEVGGIGDVVILHLKLSGLDPFAVFAELDAVDHDGVEGVTAQ